MNCPVCNRNLASTLSICPSCGAMMHDSVREELHDKISPIVRTVKNEMRGNEAVPNKPLPPLTPKPALPSVNPTLPSVNVNQPQLTSVKTDTAEIAAKATSPTLVEFQNKNATLPEWRLQLQNAVRKRRDNTSAEPMAPAKPQPVVQKVLATNGSAALKAEIVEQPAPLPTGNAKLENALRRIEESRRKFLLEERDEVLPKAEPTAPPPSKNYPFYIASKNAEILPKPAEPKAELAPPKPIELKTVAAPVPIIEDLPIIEKKDFDTNKLKPLPNSSIISSNIGKVSTGELTEPPATEPPIITISRAKTDDDEELEIEETSFENDLTEEEIEAFAPLSMRFNAAVFDLIIGAFASLILLAPFMIAGGRWLSIAGVLAFLVTCTIVMFIYLTTAVGFFGQTIGMKLFSLEIIDIQEEEYPTLHQAAVNSSVYLVSLVFGGIGFLPALFNEEKRAAHDLLSGTIVVREEG